MLLLPNISKDFSYLLTILPSTPFPFNLHIISTIIYLLGNSGTKLLFLCSLNATEHLAMTGEALDTASFI